MAVQIYTQKSNAWRDAYNPLRGMNLGRLMSMLDAGERGEYADIQWFYHFMERSDPMVFAVMQRRRAALLACDWDIRVSSEVPREARIQKSESRIQKNSGTGQGKGQIDLVLADEQAAVLRDSHCRIPSAMRLV